MKSWFNFTKVQPIPAGVYQKQEAPADQPPYRVHLRLQADGSGVMVVNAATVLHLNPTAAEYAYHFIKGSEPEAAAREVADRYRVRPATALEDFRQFADRIQALITTPDLDPETNLDFERAAPHAALTAPLRLDCALTYRLPAGTQADYAPTKRVDRELATDEWRTVFEQAWQFGIPHVTLTGGEATLRDDLVELIGHVERIGQVCGLLTDGLKLADEGYADSLLQAGLDHVLFILQPERAASWQALGLLMPKDVYVTAHISVRRQEAKTILGYLDRLAEMGLTSLSLTVADSSIPVGPLQDGAAARGLTLKHDLPVPYSSDHPLAEETKAEQAPEGAGRAWLYVEPDGDVLPSQGMSDQILGNVTRDPWSKIYRPG
jgi:hypothetical protein